MDRLLAVEPKEVAIRFEEGQRCSGFVELRNVMYTMPVAFRVHPMKQKKYSVKPSCGIISPLRATSVEIIMQPQGQLPEVFPHSDDQFVIQSVVVPGGKETETVSLDWFTARKKQVFEDSALKVMFTGGSILTKLVADGSVEEIREVLEKDEESVDSCDEQGRSLLHMAVASRRPDLVQVLIEFRVDMEAQNRMGQTALHVAAIQGEGLIAELLLANGANAGAKDSSGWQAAHFAASAGHVDVLRLVVQNGGDVNGAVSDGRTALHMAVDGGYRNCLKGLLVAGADVDARADDGDTALHRAAARADSSMVRLLMQKGANKDIRNKQGKTPYDLAADTGDSALLDILRLGDGLRRAARRGDVRSVQRCLEQGAAINGKDQHGWTALHRAAFKGWLEIVKALVDKGADLDGRDDEGYTALHCAAESGHMELVELLLKKGVDVNARSKRGVTPLQIAISLHYSGVARSLEGGGAVRDNSNNNTKSETLIVYDITPLPAKKISRRNEGLQKPSPFRVQYGRTAVA
ncbi:hypothetical protein KI387_042362 [Taxus chinensis]|uniref:MSP domain-containing protein n=1 Tax=Taxus chinensis TaxID=29808 RepID=A0AA38F8M6_TAXCH|nr:hypothetical protein KI387_042362 [Taxus chinensis]